MTNFYSVFFFLLFLTNHTAGRSLQLRLKQMEDKRNQSFKGCSHATLPALPLLTSLIFFFSASFNTATLVYDQILIRI